MERKKFLFVFPFAASDREAAKRSATLIAKFGPYDCDCMVQPTQGTQHDDIVELLKPVFKQVWVQIPYDTSPQTWPAAPNHMFRHAAKYVQETDYDYFYFWEPDDLPIREGWMEELRAEYESSGKPFMGVIHPTKLRNAEGKTFLHGVHMVGTGFYPREVYKYSWRALVPNVMAWDVAGQSDIVPNAHETKKIQHDWSTGGYRSLKQLRPEAVVHHGCKDESLYLLLTGEKESEDYDGPPELVGNMHAELPPQKDEPVVPPAEPEVFEEALEEDLVSTHDAVIPHAVAMLSALCTDVNARRKIQRALQKAGLTAPSKRGSSSRQRASG